MRQREYSLARRMSPSLINEYGNDMNDKTLFEPYTLGSLTLSNRVVMAPLTRNRAGEGFVPSEFAATYYSQRASTGLLISEASQISQQGQGYQDTPGIYTQAQIDGWRKVTDAVHAKGGRIFLQLWHVGRVSHVDLQENGAAPVAPSALRPATKVFVNNSFLDVSEPRALDISELPGIVNDFRQAAANAIAAGFDGVEIHGANGYLLDQFVKDGANIRTDAYGGSIENRARLLLEVTAAVVAEVGAERTGIRISPVSPANGVSSSEPQAQFDYIVDQLDALGIVYLHVVEGATGGPRDIAPFDFGSLRQRFKNTYIANNGYDVNLATSQLNDNKADLIAVGLGGAP
jgi:N-ethylmaleimide reductase